LIIFYAYNTSMLNKSRKGGIMKNEKRKVKKEINLYIHDLLEIAEMFKEQGLQLDGVFIEDTECNFKTGDEKHIKELDLHGSDMFKSGTRVLVRSQDDEKHYTAWYRFEGKYLANRFEYWKLVQESTIYK
jgi:hypothetical protein